MYENMQPSGPSWTFSLFIQPYKWFHDYSVIRNLDCWLMFKQLRIVKFLCEQLDASTHMYFVFFFFFLF